MKPALPVAVLLALAFGSACGRPGVPDSTSRTTQKLPFDRQPGSGGTSPTESFVPAVARIPEGTAITIRLSKPLSSVSAQQGDSFDGKLDDPIVVDGQTLIASGALVSGRVLEARHSSGPHAPGYLRIALVSVDSGGKTTLIDTSAVFDKGTDRSSAGSPGVNPSRAGIPGDVTFASDRRLTFRLAQPVDLQ